MSESSTPAATQKPRILFVCAGNTCRSVLAEHIARKKFGRFIDTSSAGLQPGTVVDAENAIYTLKTLLNVDATSHQPRDVRTVDVERFDLIIAMNNQIATEVQRLFPNLSVERLVKWRIKDPYGDDLAEYRQCAHAIHAALKRLPLLAGKQ